MIRAAPVSGLLFFCFSKSSQKGIKKSILTTFFFFLKKAIGKKFAYLFDYLQMFFYVFLCRLQI